MADDTPGDAGNQPDDEAIASDDVQVPDLRLAGPVLEQLGRPSGREQCHQRQCIPPVDQPQYRVVHPASFPSVAFHLRASVADC
jgi:hypothetical protein